MPVCPRLRLGAVYLDEQQISQTTVLTTLLTHTQKKEHKKETKHLTRHCLPPCAQGTTRVIQLFDKTWTKEQTNQKPFWKKCANARDRIGLKQKTHGCSVVYMQVATASNTVNTSSDK